MMGLYRRTAYGFDTVDLGFTGSNRILPRGYLTLPFNHLPHKLSPLKGWR